MAEHQLRYNIGDILARLLMSLAIWGMIAGLPLVIVWAVSVRQPTWFYPVGAVALAAWLVYTRKHWQRVLDRSPQSLISERQDAIDLDPGPSGLGADP